uniref:Uncharacterized protein n=1 Tax=Anguilla anguilla TaxID=7936 RepID=A0A0E9PH39_ANGAN
MCVCACRGTFLSVLCGVSGL